MQTEVIEVDPLSNNKELYARVAALLEQGDIVGLPTETVYGLGANALNAQAVAKVFEVKERPAFDPLIIHLAHPKDLTKYALIPAELQETVQTLSEQFWPGPLTMVLPKQDIVPDLVTAGLPTVAVRVSAHPVMRGVAKALGKPVAAPSANRFGHISPTSATAVMKELGGKIGTILDAGACSEGLESTIIRPLIDAKNKPAIEILREGPIAREQFRNIVKVLPRKHTGGAETGHNAAPVAPGQLNSHYAPGKPLILWESDMPFSPEPGVRYGLLSYEGTSELAQAEHWQRTVTLSPGKARLAEAAVRLFALMRQLDEADDVDVIVAEPVPETGLGRAMMDRLRRAAAKRD